MVIVPWHGLTYLANLGGGLWFSLPLSGSDGLNKAREPQWRFEITQKFETKRWKEGRKEREREL